MIFMKKLIFILPAFLVLGLAAPVLASNSESGTQIGQQIQKQTVASPSSTGNQVQNMNQVKTQNEGENSQLKVSTQEQEDLGENQDDGLENRNQNAIENMSKVATQVQQLLQMKTSGGIGEQVRQIAQEQNQAQTQTQDQINKLESRKGIAKSLLGPDYGAIKSLKTLLEQNQLRIQQLEQLKNQLSNSGDIAMVQETIQALVQENTSLQELINTEEQTRSFFGWLFRMFVQ